MPDSQPTRRRPPANLLTRDQILAELRRERGMDGLTKTAARYEIAPQQLCDVLAGRSQLSKRMAERMKLVIWTLYEKRGEK